MVTINNKKREKITEASASVCLFLAGYNLLDFIVFFVCVFFMFAGPVYCDIWRQVG